MFGLGNWDLAQQLNAYVRKKLGIGSSGVAWDDLQVGISNIRVPASNAPTERLYNAGIGGGLTFPFLGFAVNDYLYFDIQSTHSMKLSTIMENHIHVTTPTNGTNDKFKFQLDAIYANVNSNWAVPTGSPYTKEQTMTADWSNYHAYQEIAEIPAVNTAVSCMYKCILTRIAASADEYAGEVYVSFIDCHIGKDGIGSTQETQK